MPNETEEHKKWKIQQKEEFERNGYNVFEEYPANNVGNDKFDLVAKKEGKFIILEYDRGNFNAQTFKNLYKGLHLKPTKIIHDCGELSAAKRLLIYSKAISAMLPQIEIVIRHNGKQITELSNFVEKKNIVPYEAKNNNYIKCYLKDKIWLITLIDKSGKSHILKHASSILEVLDKDWILNDYPECSEELCSYFNKNKFWIDVFAYLNTVPNIQIQEKFNYLLEHLNKFQVIENWRFKNSSDKELNDLKSELHCIEKLDNFGKIYCEVFPESID